MKLISNIKRRMNGGIVCTYQGMDAFSPRERDSGERLVRQRGTTVKRLEETRGFTERRAGLASGENSDKDYQGINSAQIAVIAGSA